MTRITNTHEYVIGYDWDEAGGVFAVVDKEGKRKTTLRVPATKDGIEQVKAMAEPYRNPATGALPPVSVESTRRPILYALQAAGFEVWLANADVLRSYRKQSRRNVRIKSDAADAAMLAERFFKFPEQNRPLPPMKSLGVTLGALTRMQFDLMRDGVDEANRLRSLLAEANPVFLKVWTVPQLTDSLGPARYIAEHPTLTGAENITEEQILQNLWAVGRKARGRIYAKKIHDAYKAEYLSYAPEADEAFGKVISAQAKRLLGILETKLAIEEQIAATLAEHPAYELLKDAYGAGPITLARTLAEIGEDPYRFSSKRGFLAFAAVIPYTEQSGGGQRNRRRQTKGNRLHSALFDWAQTAALHHPGAKTYYWERRDRGDWHPTAVRKVAERIASGIWHCMTTGEMWDDTVVWPEPRADLDEFILKVREKNDARKSKQAVNHGIKNPTAA